MPCSFHRLPPHKERRRERHEKMFLMLMGGCLLFASAGCVDQVNLGKLGGAASNLHAAATLDDAELKAMCVQMRQKGDAEAAVASRTTAT